MIGGFVEIVFFKCFFYFIFQSYLFFFFFFFTDALGWWLDLTTQNVSIC